MIFLHLLPIRIWKCPATSHQLSSLVSETNSGRMVPCLLKIGLLASVTFGQEQSEYAPDSGYELSAAGSTYGASDEVGPDAAFAAESGEVAYEDYLDYPLLEDQASHDPIESIAENLPVFIVALAAVIFGQQIFFPLISPLLDPASLATILSPVGNVKIGILNIFLAPFGVAICTLAPTIAVVNPFGRSFSGDQRNSPDGFTINAEPAVVENIASTLYKAFLGNHHSILPL